MVKHLMFTIAASGLIIFCMFYPFLPGQYDGMAVTLSAMAQLFALAGLALVPLGMVWLVCEIWIRNKSLGARPSNDAGYWFGMASIGVATMVVIVIALGTTIDAHYSLGVGLLGLWAYFARRLFAGLRARRRAELHSFNPAPLHMIVVPIVAVAIRFSLIDSASEFSRNRAIDNSAPLIAAIENYRDVHGEYPRSLQSLWEDYRPWVIGIERYHYEPNGESYNLYFENFSSALDIREIVMYNQCGEHEFTSHNADLLELTAAQLDLMRGYIAVRDAARRHWKYFLFD